MDGEMFDGLGKFRYICENIYLVMCTCDSVRGIRVVEKIWSEYGAVVGM